MKRKSGLFLIAGLLSSVQVFATLTPTIERGEKNVYHQSPRGIQEVCVIPAKYPDAKYSKGDVKKEVELCNYSFYPVSAEELATGSETVAMCAKTNSTNPAINIYEINTKTGQTKASVENEDCEKADKIGKYKNSTSCSYTPSIIGYYHLSRILGGIGRVPVSVLRSMDIETHKELAEQGLANSPEGDLIHQTWQGISGILNAGLSSSRKDLVLSDDGQQSYGGFIVNPKKENFYKDLFTAGPDRAIAFRDKNALFQLVRNSAPLNEIVSSAWNQANVQKLFAMRDITEFILLDHIMDQQDRFGNIAMQTREAYMAKDKPEDQKFDLEVSKDDEDYQKAKTAGLVDLTRAPLQVNSMILKDNDCGVSKTNVVKEAQLLKEIAHMEPKTYKKLLEFQKSIGDNKKFFTSNLMFTSTDYNEMVANVNDAVRILKANCESGDLKLDLDVEHYLETGSLKAGSCDLEEKATQ